MFRRQPVEHRTPGILSSELMAKTRRILEMAHRFTKSGNQVLRLIEYRRGVADPVRDMFRATLLTYRHLHLGHAPVSMHDARGRIVPYRSLQVHGFSL